MGVGRGWGMAEADRVGVVVTTYDALPWLEDALRSVAGLPVVVVDNGSADGTPAFVRERFPEVRVVEQPNLGLAAGWNRGIAELGDAVEHVLVLNADAWLLPGALDELVAASVRHPRAAAVVPRLENPDGSLQRSVRGFPTPWRIATEYLYLRKLAPGSRAVNAFYGAGFGHDVEQEVEWAMGACLLVRRSAFVEVGPFDERYFLFSEEVDWYRRAADRGWTCVFVPTARCAHVGGASHGGRLFRENVRGHLRYLDAHEGRRAAERGRRVMWAGVAIRALMARGARRDALHETARWLRSGDAGHLLEGRAAP